MGGLVPRFGAESLGRDLRLAPIISTFSAPTTHCEEQTAYTTSCDPTLANAPRHFGNPHVSYCLVTSL